VDRDTHTPSRALGVGNHVGGALFVLEDAALDGPANMARDEALLHCDALRPAVLRLYAWSPPTISLGYFQRFEQLGGLEPELRALDVVRRTTGGGAILHDREVTYCLVLDDRVPIARQAPAELYRVCHRCWSAAVALSGLRTELAPDSAPLPSPRSGPFFCFQTPGRTDLLLGAEKVLGSAQRRIPGRVLQHGSLILGRRFAGHPGGRLNDPPLETVQLWIGAFVAELGAALGLTPRRAAWPADALADADARRARYASEAWTRRR